MDLPTWFENIAARSRALFGNRRSARRYRVTLPLIAVVPDLQQHTLTVVGKTRDVSESGLGFVLPGAGIEASYFMGEDQTLHVLLNLPTTGSILLSITPVRYERVVKGPTEKDYLVGARILEKPDDTDRERYLDYVRSRPGG